MMKLHEILADPFLIEEVRKRACSGRECHIGPSVKLKPVSERWQKVQSQNSAPGVQARDTKAETRGENGPGERGEGA